MRLADIKDKLLGSSPSSAGRERARERGGDGAGLEDSGSEAELRRALEREREAVEQLRDLDRLKDDFLSTVSHELRTPLTSIKGFAQVLLSSDDLDEDLRRDMLERVSRNASEMAAMVEQLLDFSRLQAGKVAIESVRIQLREAVERSLELTGELLRAHSTTVDVPEDIEVVADPRGLERILVNLLSNAAKFSHPGASVRVHATVDGGQAIVGVDDEGIGIPAEEQPRVFERFYQGTLVQERGTGVGLSIVMRYVELQGGRVWVESEPGSGARFRFTLPLANLTGPAATAVA